MAHFVLGTRASNLILSGDPATASPGATPPPPGELRLGHYSHRRAAGQDPLSGDLLMPIYYRGVHCCDRLPRSCAIMHTCLTKIG